MGAPPASAPTFDLTLLDDRFVVYRLEPSAPVPPALLSSRHFCSITRTDDELSIVCTERDAPEDVRGRTWRGLKVHGPLPFGMVGVLASLTRTLAEAGVSLLAIATHDTDYLFVERADLQGAIRALRDSGHRVISAAASREPS